MNHQSIEDRWQVYDHTIQAELMAISSVATRNNDQASVAMHRYSPVRSGENAWSLCNVTTIDQTLLPLHYHIPDAGNMISIGLGSRASGEFLCNSATQDEAVLSCSAIAYRKHA
jgi:hypothetical protein